MLLSHRYISLVEYLKLISNHSMVVGVKVSLLKQVHKYLLGHALSIISVSQGLLPSDSHSSESMHNEMDLKLYRGLKSTENPFDRSEPLICR